MSTAKPKLVAGGIGSFPSRQGIKPKMPRPPCYTLEQVCERTGKNFGTARGWLAGGKLPLLTAELETVTTTTQSHGLRKFYSVKVFLAWYAAHEAARESDPG